MSLSVISSYRILSCYAGKSFYRFFLYQMTFNLLCFFICIYNSEYRVRSKLPLVFIMGLATTTALQQQLHHRTSVCLATKSFQTKPSVGLLNQLIGKLFMDESVLKIGPRLIQVLLDGFLYHDLSLNSFLHRIHLIVMQHFITLPVSILCCPINKIPVTILFLYISCYFIICKRKRDI